MLHITMNGNATVEKYWEFKIMKIVNHMRNTDYYDINDDSGIRCLGVALRANGEMVAFTNTVSAYPQGILMGFGVMKEMTIVGSPLENGDISWKTFVENYNDTMISNIEFFGDYAIVAYYIFDAYEDTGDKTNNLSENSKNTDDAFNELSKIRENFMNSHNERMHEFDAAIESLNKTLKATADYDNEITQTLDKTSKELDELLNSL